MASSQAVLDNQPQPQQSNEQSPEPPYTLTEEEKKLLRECQLESFWYRALPISVGCMILSKGLIARGLLTTSGMFGSLPKIAFAGVFGYLAGSVSYVKTCRNKFKTLENSRVGEAFRQRDEYYAMLALSPKAEYSRRNVGRSAAQEEQTPLSTDSGVFDSSPATVPFSSSFSESSTTGITDGLVPDPTPSLEDAPKQRTVTYSDLRNKHRETNAITATQKSDTPVQPVPSGAPRKDVKTNKYGDVWEE